MATNPTTINGFDLYPSKVVPSPMWYGGPIRRSLSGKGRRKRVSSPNSLVLRFDCITADEKALVDIVWIQAGADAVTIVNEDHGISGRYLLADSRLNFEPLDGAERLWAGSMSFEAET